MDYSFNPNGDRDTPRRPDGHPVDAFFDSRKGGIAWQPEEPRETEVPHETVRLKRIGSVPTANSPGMQAARELLSSKTTEEGEQ